MTTQELDLYVSIRKLLWYFREPGDHSDLSDLHHDIFLKVWPRLLKIKHLRTFLYITVFGYYRNYLQKSRRYVSFENSMSGAVQPDEFQEAQRPTLKSKIKLNYEGRTFYFDSVTQAAKTLGCSRTTFYKNHCFQRMNHNIFPGNLTHVSRVITRRTYDQDSSYYKNYIYDPDRGADYNETYSLYIHKQTGEGLLIREKDENPTEKLHVRYIKKKHKDESD